MGALTGVDATARRDHRLFLAATLLIGVYPIAYAGMFAGDAIVHLVYAEHAAEGEPFVFNLGETSSGVTSPGFMLVVAGLYRVLPDSCVPLALKLLTLAAWYLVCWLVFRVARLVGLPTLSACLVALANGLLPGSAYNATIGMENGIFALLFVALLALALRHNALGKALQVPSRVLLVNSILLGTAAWIRPEGFVVAALWLAARAWRLLRGRSGLRAVRALATESTPLALMAVALVGFHYVHTGSWLPTSGRSRMLMAAHEAWIASPLLLDASFALRLAAYAPLTLLALIGLIAVWSRAHWNSHTGLRRPTELRFASISFGVFFLLYSVVFGAAHLARYVIFLMPVLCLLAGVGGYILWTRWNGVVPRWAQRCRLALFATLAVALVAVFATETALRRKLGSHQTLEATMDAPSRREESSDEMLTLLGHTGDFPVVIGTEAVHIRYWLDERFTVRSLDGRVDERLLDFASADFVDHVAYIKARDIQYLLDLPNYNRDAGRFSLADLRPLENGATRDYRGLRFRKLPTAQVVSVESLDATKRKP